MANIDTVIRLLEGNATSIIRRIPSDPYNKDSLRASLRETKRKISEAKRLKKQGVTEVDHRSL